MPDISANPSLCFQLLQLQLTAIKSEVKTAYRIRARQCHPDHNQADPKAEEKFNLLHQAYQGALRYVQTKPAAAQPQSAPGPGERPPHYSRFRPPAGMGKLSQQQRCTRARKAYRTALGYLKTMQDYRAWPLLQEALWLDPTDVAIRYKLEDVALYTGRLRELDAFLQAVDRDRPQVPPPASPCPSLPLITPPPKAEPPTPSASPNPAEPPKPPKPEPLDFPEPPDSPEPSEPEPPVFPAPPAPEPEWQVTASTPIAPETLSLENLEVPVPTAPELPGEKPRQRPAPRRRTQQQQDISEILILPGLLYALDQLLHHPLVAATARTWKKDPRQVLLLLALGGLCGSLLTVLVYRLSAPSDAAIAPPTATAQALHQPNPSAD